ncbi:HD domain-containing protein [Brevibacterium oceani]|uniref:HD domain-containing protein n=1 Tax=Brevibacterium oceani TaxID=358099 RepID=UPI0015E685E1|nr:HD domain-containing protein [Brevibacterium oceani]
MSALPTLFPRVPLKRMDAAMLVVELDRETSRLMPGASELITSALTMASFLHRNQTRFVRGDMDRVPYIEHPLRVALRMIRWGSRDGELIAAALLHDILEDCGAELVEVFGDPERDDEAPAMLLKRLYGHRVAHLVTTVTNPKARMSHAEYREHIAALASSGSEALLIKASDLKDNAGSIRHQLGHGMDEKLLRMLKKYLPAVSVVADEIDRSAHRGTAGDDVRRLDEELRELAREHGVA